MFRLVTLYTPDYKPASSCVPTVRAYAEKQGYAFTEHTEAIYKEMAPAWSKIPAVSMALIGTENDWVVWVDADIKITDPSVRLEDIWPKDPKLEIVFSQDKDGLCSGFFGVRRTYRTLGIFLEALNRHSFTEDAWPWEQKALKDLFAFYGCYEDIIGYIPESVVSNPFSGPQGTFAHHYWGNGMHVPT